MQVYFRLRRETVLMCRCSFYYVSVVHFTLFKWPVLAEPLWHCIFFIWDDLCVSLGNYQLWCNENRRECACWGQMECEQQEKFCGLMIFFSSWCLWIGSTPYLFHCWWGRIVLGSVRIRPDGVLWKLFNGRQFGEGFPCERSGWGPKSLITVDNWSRRHLVYSC